MIYTLCGSSRFPEAFHLANAHLSLCGHIVISLGLFGHADEPCGAQFLTSDGDETTPEKIGLDQLHFRKIDLADAIFVVNFGVTSVRARNAKSPTHSLRARRLNGCSPPDPPSSRRTRRERI